MITTLWQGLVLAGITTFCLRLAPRTSAALRFSLWTAALLFICLLPFVAIADPLRSPVFHAAPGWNLALAALWLMLSLVRAADLARHGLRLRSLSREAMPVSAGLDLASLLRTHRDAQLCTSTQLDRPGVIGFLHPRILIPVWLFNQLTAPELEQIVLHELEHLRRRDDWLNLLQKLILVVFPLNFALYWIDCRLCLERELACDEGVVRRTRAPRRYATCLARLAEHGLDHRTVSLTLGFLERQSELARRVTGVLRTPRTLSPRQSFAFTGTFAAFLLIGSAELARCPQIVSFAAVPVALTANSGTPGLAPETWVSRPGVYTNHATPRLVQAALKQVRKPLRKAKARHAHPPVTMQRAAIKQTISSKLLGIDVIQTAPTAPTPVRYTFVRVEGGWLLLQL